jgi:protein-tyrosine phosphatase
MIDLHAHILPGVDDGAQDMEEALEMARVGVEDGLQHLVATPHTGLGKSTTKADVQEQVASLQENLQAEGIPLQLHVGAEVYIDSNLSQLVMEERAFTIDGSRYLLLELPFQQYPIYTGQVIFSAQTKGIVPILAHPERNRVLQGNLGLLEDLVRRGVLIQVNAGSLLGSFGHRVQRTAEAMLVHNLSHIIASDAHSLYFRPPVLSEAVAYASKLVGGREAEAMVTTVPQSVIDDRLISVPEPLEFRSRRNRLSRR